MTKRIKIVESILADRKADAKKCTATELTNFYKKALNIGDDEARKIIEAELYDRGYTFHIAPLTTILLPIPEMFSDDLVCMVVDVKGDIDTIFERAEDLHNKTGDPQMPAAVVLRCYTIALIIGEDLLAQKLANFIKRCNTYDQLIKGYLQRIYSDKAICKRLSEITKMAEEYRSW